MKGIAGLQVQFKLLGGDDRLAVGGKGDAIGRLRGVDPCRHGLLTVIDKDLHAVFVQQDAEFQGTVLAAHLAAAGMHDVGAGTRMAAVQRQL